MKFLLWCSLTCVLFLCCVAPSIAQQQNNTESDPEIVLVPDGESGWIEYNVTEDEAAAEQEPIYNAESDVIFTLFTKEDQAMGQVIQLNDPSSVQNSSFNASLPTKVTIHGFLADATTTVSTNVKDAFFSVGQFNVISVDWSAGAKTINYVAARRRVEATGAVVGSVLRMISEETGADLGQMSVIGHSLGAHIAGFAGKNLTGQLRSIVGLDPAAPLFPATVTRLNATDAQYVQVIHTAAFYGIQEPIGQGDFYPNGGASQPGCITSVCSHMRVSFLFAESINSTAGFWARKCPDGGDITDVGCMSSGEDVLMGGEPLNVNAQGIYYLETNRKTPYAQGKQGIN